MHANTITFDSVRVGSAAPANAPANVRQAIAGRSPRMHAEYEKFLVQGLESGRGLFQFISPRALRVSNESREKPSKVTPIIDQLDKAIKDCTTGNVRLAGRYDVIALDKISGNATDHSCYQLTVFDTVDNKHITVPLTQAGLRFDQRVLEPDDIERANVLLDQHRNRLGQCDTAAPDPMIVSTGGIGRNATLITYRQVLARMGSGLNSADLLEEIEVAVKDGRRDRGPGFIHSEKQLEALHDALEQKMRQPANVGTTATAASLHPVVQSRSRPRSLSLPRTPPADPYPSNPNTKNIPREVIMSDEERCKAADVNEIAQLPFCGHYNRDVSEQMKDVCISLGSAETKESWLPPLKAKSLVDDVYQNLKKSRDIQKISGGNLLCWLRSSWLPLFAALTPNQLEERLLKITPSALHGHSKTQIIPVLRAIATQYRQDPAAFMKGEKPKSRNLSVASLRSALETDAVLGPSSKLTDALPNLPKNFVPSHPDQTIESFLRELQLNIAAAFREKITMPVAQGEKRYSLMEEVAKLSTHYDLATSDLPVTLHRAFNVPVVVVEKRDAIGLLRVTRDDVKYIDHANALTQSDELTQQSITEVMSAFKHEFVIKLTGIHYELFLPEK
ncbi:hypothetical protein QN362_14200 [Actimicrobium sp. CCC2.4]|uniref:hypothetical protein n=1 Tax=Actimicrobium sp. CCC2.4 TaxID=3048606 RepID=UPI002AC96712|nr:hypothetical protein [Actimicrobium sp. CCC2.4]MEB0136488.1 hypothetical protein [Actimicrobium sp. CCC2.4]WPX30849.1 hypothetical protein RHM62_11290 [Actimicrobium sp. CCC2.4]